MNRRRALTVFAGAFCARGFAETAALPLRKRVEAYNGSGDWQPVTLEQRVDFEKSAIIVCDLWDKHWCRGATERVNELAAKMAPVLDQARKRGVLIIHAPSETMEFYKDAPQRLAIAHMERISPPSPLALDAPPLPIDDSRGGCDTGDSFYKAWSREHPSIVIGPNDLISDNGAEVYSALKLRGINTLFVMGVHANMCILNRSFAIKQMTKWGIRCILVRDLTDAMYNPADRPYVTHARGTELVVEHIEKYWCPTTTASDLLRGFAAAKSN